MRDVFLTALQEKLRKEAAFAFAAGYPFVAKVFRKVAEKPQEVPLRVDRGLVFINLAKALDVAGYPTITREQKDEIVEWLRVRGEALVVEKI